MSWTEQDGFWSRSLDCHDIMFQFIGAMGAPLGREHWLMMQNAQLDFPEGVDAVSRLREAWKALRFRHPDIALEIHENDKRYYPVRDGKALEVWCNETFRIEAASSADEFFCHQHPLPGPYATLHWIPARNQIVLAAAHSRWDGRGATMMLHQLLSELENPSPLPTAFDGSEAKNLVPSLDAVIGMPEKNDVKWEQRADEMVQQVIEGQPSIGLLPPGDQKALPGDTLRTEVVVPAEEALALRAAARVQGISLTTAMHASAVVETARANPDSPAKYFTSWAPYDLRKYCPEPFNGMVHAPSLRLVALPLSVEARASWSDLTRAIHEIYRQSWDLDKSDMMFVRVPYVEKATAMFKAAPPDMPPPADPNINSMGALDDYIKCRYGDVAVKDVSFMVHMLSQQLYVHSWSWNGTLHISASYNEAYYTPDYVKKFLTALKDNMVENLGKGAT
jgi:hypothetical protein